MIMTKVHVFPFYEKLKLSLYVNLFLLISPTQESTKSIAYTHLKLTE